MSDKPYSEVWVCPSCNYRQEIGVPVHTPLYCDHGGRRALPQTAMVRVEPPA